MWGIRSLWMVFSRYMMVRPSQQEQEQEPGAEEMEETAVRLQAAVIHCRIVAILQIGVDG